MFPAHSTLAHFSHVPDFLPRSFLPCCSLTSPLYLAYCSSIVHRSSLTRIFLLSVIPRSSLSCTLFVHCPFRSRTFPRPRSYLTPRTFVPRSYLARIRLVSRSYFSRLSLVLARISLVTHSYYARSSSVSRSFLSRISLVPQSQQTTHKH